MTIDQSHNASVQVTSNGAKPEQTSEGSRVRSLIKYDKTGKRFIKHPIDPSLFTINVPKKHMEHLLNDDLDEISKFEVIYKVLKDQLRDHQHKLIELKKKQKKTQKSPVRAGVKAMKLNEFAKLMKPFEFHGSQRSLSPELKRIVKNLVCQDH